MTNLSDQLWTNLTEAQRDGLACIWCHGDDDDPGSPDVPVGRCATTGSQVFACEDICLPDVKGTVIRHNALGETAPIDVEAARQQLNDPLITTLARARVLVEETGAAIEEAQRLGLDVTAQRGEWAEIAERVAKLGNAS